MEEQKKKILCVGLVCLDIISVVEKYPEEDTDSRLETLIIHFVSFTHFTNNLVFFRVISTFSLISKIC